jgi:hypothetical protein
LERADNFLDLIRPQQISSFKETVAIPQPVATIPDKPVVSEQRQKIPQGEKRKETDTKEKEDDEGFKRPEAMPVPSGKRRMVASVMSSEEAMSQSKMEGGSVEEWIAPDEIKKSKDMKAALSKYGY